MDRRREVLPVCYSYKPRNRTDTELAIIRKEIAFKAEIHQRNMLAVEVLWRDMKTEDVDAIQELLSSDSEDEQDKGKEGSADVEQELHAPISTSPPTVVSKSADTDGNNYGGK